MTAQIPEVLHYNGQKLAMCSVPLHSYFQLMNTESPFSAPCTALWRGYIGEWEIKDDRLYLVGLSTNLFGQSEGAIEKIFPNFQERLFANWYSGILRIPMGKIIEYVHGGFGSVYEKDLFIEVEQGVVKSNLVQTNGKSSDGDGDEGYGVGALTMFPKSN